VPGVRDVSWVLIRWHPGQILGLREIRGCASGIWGLHPNEYRQDHWALAEYESSLHSA
jgi:hypothetical protein